MSLEEQVDLKDGSYKYVCLRITPPDLPPRPFLLVRRYAYYGYTYYGHTYYGHTYYGYTYYGPSSSCAGMHIPCMCHAYTMPAYTPASCGVCSAAGSYHRDVGASPTAKFEARGCRVEALGGGRIMLDSVRRSVHVFGYSVGLGGDEGGPPGRGMPDHSQAATTYYGCTMATYSLTHSLAYSLTLTTHSLLAPGCGPRAPRAARSRGHLLRGGLLTLPSYRPTAVTLAAEGY